MKKKYNSPKLEVTNFDVEDVITTSGASNIIGNEHELELNVDSSDLDA